MPTTPPLSRLRRHGLRLFAVTAVLCLAQSLNAALVVGRLLYRNGAPASDVAVRLNSSAGVTPFAYSVRDGKFYLQGVAAGRYTMEIWKNRVLVIKQPLTVKEPTTTVPDIKLP